MIANTAFGLLTDLRGPFNMFLDLVLGKKVKVLFVNLDLFVTINKARNTKYAHT